MSTYDQPPKSKSQDSGLDLAPWGSPPTPLLPRWYREEFSGSQLPKKVKMVNPLLETVGELDAFWDGVQSPVGSDVVDSLASLVGSRRPPVDYVVIPAGIDHKELSELPLRRRTANVLEDLYARGLLTGDNDLTVGFLMSTKSFGRRSLLDLMCVAEVALALRGLESGTQEPEKETEAPAGYPTTKWVQFVHQLDVLLAAASEFYGAGTVGEALRIDLYGLASKIGISPELDSLGIGELTKRSTIRHTVIKRLTDLHRSMEPKELQVFKRRLCTDNPDTLEDLGKSIGVVRQRVSQIEQTVREKVEERVGMQVGLLASFIGEQMPPVMDASELDVLVTGVFPESDEKLSTDFAIRMVRERLDYSCANGICLSNAATRVVNALGEVAYVGGDDVGLLEEQVLRDQLPDETWSTYFPQIIQACGFFHFGTWVSPKATLGARAKAALLKFGRLATVEEIAEISGLAVSQVGVQFRRMATVVRADKDRWGLSEWIDDEYEGISAEIVQRIKEDGGATSLQGLVEELPRRFGVSESSVQIIAGTKQFSIRDGYVSLASETSIALGNFDDVLDGRTETGEPYWTFRVEARHFQGHSLTRFPAELARELGCEPNGKARVKVQFPECCRDLSVSWRLSSPTGPSLGYLSDPLRQLGVSDGDRIRLILNGSGGVELRPDISGGSRSQPRSANSFLDAMKQRRSISERADG